jgi:hypothetical protein
MNKVLKEIIKSVILEVHEEEFKKLGVPSEKTGLKTLRVFDFDDTLAKTNSKVGITEYDKETGKQIKPEYMITPAQYATFKEDVTANNPSIEYKYDYREFAEVVDPKIIDWTFGVLNKIVRKLRASENIPAVILTARGEAANKNIRGFLQSMDINIPVKTLSGSAPELKSEWIKQTMLDRNIPHVEFFDDSRLNVAAVKELNNDPDLIETFKQDLRVRSRLVQSE